MKLDKIPNKTSYYLRHYQHSTQGKKIERIKDNEQWWTLDEHQEHKCRNVWIEKEIKGNRQPGNWNNKLGTNTIQI